MAFVVSSISLVLSLFFSPSRFFIIFVNSSGFYCKLTCMLRVLRCYILWGFRNSFNGVFLLIKISYLLVLLGIISGVGYT